MIILAIDPGPKNSAYVIWQEGAILSLGIIPCDELLTRKWSVEHPSIDVCVIESIASYGMPVGEEIFATCRWIGRYQERWAQRFPQEPARLLLRMLVKLHHCNTARARDSNIRQALINRYGPPGTKKKQGILYGVVQDIWAAVAIATYVEDTNG